MSAKASKKLVNEVDQVVKESLAGYSALNPGVRILDGYNVVVRSDLESYAASKKVAILSGGGSGHEPLFLGYIGPGMLTGGVHGSVFASPGPTSVLAGIRALAKNNPAGVLILFLNYTGDRLTFGQAAEQATSEGIKVRIVINADDCAVIGRDKTAGRRGLCGHIFLMKIAGAMAEEGKPLDEIVTVLKQAQQGLGTLGICLGPCSLPGRGPLFTVGPDDLEIGLGLHGEAGVKTVKMMTAKDTVKEILQIMTDPNNKACIVLNKGDHVAVMVNNLGSTSEMEMNIVCLEVISQLEQRGILVDRAYAGRFATSLEMAGVSITVLKLQDTLPNCLDAATSVNGWNKPLLAAGSTCRVTPTPLQPEEVTTESKEKQTPRGTQTSKEVSTLIYNSLQSMCQKLKSAEEELNSLDSGAGDGDCGSTLRIGAEAILSKLGSLSSPGLPVSYPYDLLLSIAEIAETSMGGTSGGVYGLLLTAAAGVLRFQVDAQSWVTALQAGVEAVQKYGGAEPGDRTMLDPLHAAMKVLQGDLAKEKASEALQAAAKAARESALSTAHMTPRAGRASYVGDKHLGQPDPGAVAVSYWMQAISDCCNPASK